MGHDLECREALADIVSDFGIQEDEPYLLHWRVIAAAKTLAHYSTAPECEELAARLRKVELNPDPENEEQVAIVKELPGQRMDVDKLASELDKAGVRLKPLPDQVSGNTIWGELSKGDYSLPCPHPERGGHHEVYCFTDGKPFCLACGRRPAQSGTEKPND